MSVAYGISVVNDCHIRRVREIDREVERGRTFCLDLESLLPSVVCGVSYVSDFIHVETSREMERDQERR